MLFATHKNLLCTLATTLTCFAGSLQAEILPQAELALKFGLANKSTTRPMTAVSYTHLDVYKRQILDQGWFVFR